MTPYSARRIKIKTYLDIEMISRAQTEVIRTRKNTYEMGVIYDYEKMLDEAVLFASSLVIEEQKSN